MKLLKSLKYKQIVLPVAGAMITAALVYVLTTKKTKLEIVVED